MESRLETFLFLGRDREAAELASGLEVETAGWRAALLFAGIASARVGDATTSRERSDRLAEFTDDGLTDLNASPGELTVGRAMIAAQLGETDEALELLRRAFAFGAKQIDEDSPLPELRHNVFFEPLWDHPEFQEIMRPKG